MEYKFARRPTCGYVSTGTYLFFLISLYSAHSLRVCSVWYHFILPLCQWCCSLWSHLTNLRPLNPKFSNVFLTENFIKTISVFSNQQRFQGKTGFPDLLTSLGSYIFFHFWPDKPSLLFQPFDDT